MARRTLRIDQAHSPLPQPHFAEPAPPAEFRSMGDSRELALADAMRHVEEKYLRRMGLPARNELELPARERIESPSVDVPQVETKAAPAAIRRAA